MKEPSRMSLTRQGTSCSSRSPARQKAKLDFETSSTTKSRKENMVHCDRNLGQKYHWRDDGTEENITNMKWKCSDPRTSWMVKPVNRCQQSRNQPVIFWTYSHSAGSSAAGSRGLFSEFWLSCPLLLRFRMLSAHTRISAPFGSKLQLKDRESHEFKQFHTHRHKKTTCAMFGPNCLSRKTPLRSLWQAIHSKPVTECSLFSSRKLPGCTIQCKESDNPISKGRTTFMSKVSSSCVPNLRWPDVLNPNRFVSGQSDFLESDLFVFDRSDFLKSDCFIFQRCEFSEIRPFWLLNGPILQKSDRFSYLTNSTKRDPIWGRIRPQCNLTKRVP